MRTSRFFALAALLFAQGCAQDIPNRDPLDETFPSVAGQSLQGEEWSLPQDLAGDDAILLVGYKQNSQFDIDRWLIAFDMREVETKILEVPTIEGLFPGLISGFIDDGMRSGIPEPIWEAVVTVYGDAGKIRQFTGTEQPNNARVLVLDDAGRVRFFHDAGFSVEALGRLLDTLSSSSRPGD